MIKHHCDTARRRFEHMAAASRYVAEATAALQAGVAGHEHAIDACVEALERLKLAGLELAVPIIEPAVAKTAPRDRAGEVEQPIKATTERKRA